MKQKRDADRDRVQEEWEYWRALVIKTAGEWKPEIEIAAAILTAITLSK